MGLIVCPSRELARQTHEVVMGYIASLKKDGFPELRALLAMGGIDMREQVCRISEALQGRHHTQASKSSPSCPCHWVQAVLGAEGETAWHPL